ncbi:MAG: SusD/RagB family nutrient-binding outer membrane lipoprotein, partial [Bacteroides acidifaciens]|nr:SusD/RagB family nutrient-binding outer membrane lipoprotein [Bacteroides acidifaciens]
MKKLSKIKNIVCALGIVTFSVSCTDNYKEWNTNPSEVPEEMLTGLMKIGNFFPTMQLDVIPTSDVDANEYQRAQNLCGDMHSGYMTPIGTWGNSSACSYNLRYDKWNDVAFDVAFTKVMPAWKQIRDNGQEKFPEAYAVAQILKVTAMHRVTDIYGPLPYLQFGHGGLETPYDSQEDIYKSFFIDLDEAIVELQQYTTNYPGSKPLAKYDLVYGGDFVKWLKFANSLKLRLAMRTCY